MGRGASPCDITMVAFAVFGFRYFGFFGADLISSLDLRGTRSFNPSRSNSVRLRPPPARAPPRRSRRGGATSGGSNFTIGSATTGVVETTGAAEATGTGTGIGVAINAADDATIDTMGDDTDCNDGIGRYGKSFWLTGENDRVAAEQPYGDDEREEPDTDDIDGDGELGDNGAKSKADSIDNCDNDS